MFEAAAREALEKAVGEIDFPLIIDFGPDKKVTAIRYESEWKTGGTEPIEDKDGNVTGYEENYKDQKLSKDRISKLDAAIASIMEA